MRTQLFALDADGIDSTYAVPEDSSRLSIFSDPDEGRDAEAIVNLLKRDQVVLVQKASPQDAESIIAGVATKLGLLDKLKLQAAFAAIHGHRANIGTYFMSVNERTDYRFIPSHSEGSRGSDINLASFYGHENSTDGGVSILQNVDGASDAWDRLREFVTKIDLCGTTLSRKDLVTARVMYHVNVPDDILRDTDHVVREKPSSIPGVKLFDVLAKPKKTYSTILDRDVYGYFDNVASIDFDSGKDYLRLLRARGLLREPTPGSDISTLDYNVGRRCWSSGVKYEALFKSMLIQNLSAGSLIIQNNLTWTHSASNWTPGSGIRKIAAAFA